LQHTINILIGDSNPVTMGIMTKAALSVPDVAVGGVARSRDMLIAKMKHLSFDLIILDLEGGEMGGVEMIDQIRELDPGMTIIVAYDPHREDHEIDVKALERGGSDSIEKPYDSTGRRYNEFRLQLITITGLLKSRKDFARSKDVVKERGKDPFVKKEGRGKKETFFSRVIQQSARITSVKVLVIASSTGGPGALVKVLPMLPADLGVPVLLVQHMPSHMTSSFAKSFNNKSDIDVVEAVDGDEILPSRVYVAPGGRHMTISLKDKNNKRFIRLNDDPHENSVRPSADVLFRSVAESYGGNILAVILTGMGMDGKNGVEKMKEKGCVCLSQGAESCVVYGMPRAVNDAGLSDESLALEMIPVRIASLVKRGN